VFPGDGYVKDVKGLVSLSQFSAIEIHPRGSPLKNVEKPDCLTWDLDLEESMPWNYLRNRMGQNL
jgi:bifunctional non-homologous end joining protein LigD